MGGKRWLFRNWFFCCFIMSSIFLTLGPAGPAIAADETDETDEFTLEEITVTAEKREAELQKIPIAISVVRPEEMEKFGVFSAEQLDELLPEVQADFTVGSFVNVSIRNVQSSFWNPIHEMSVAMHMDGVQLTRIDMFNDLFFDLQRVEVLSGPQGTLYGRGSTAGSMNFISQKPILNEHSGHLELEIGNYDEYRTELALNIPFTEKLAVRFSGRTNRRGAYDDSGFGNVDQWGGRITFNWQPTDKDQITASFDFTGHEDKGYGSTGALYGTYGDLYIVPNPRTDQIPLEVPQTWGPVTEVKLPYQTRWYAGSIAEDSSNDINGWGLSVQYDKELPFALFTGLYGHRVNRGRMDWGMAFAGLGAYYTVAGVNTYATPGNDYTDENGALVHYNDSVFINLGFGSFSNWLSWDNAVISENVTHFDSLELRLLSKQTITQGDKYEWVFGMVGSIDEVTEVNSGVFNPSWVKVTNYDQGFFGQASYALTGNLNLTGGFRWSTDVKEYAGSTGANFGNAYYWLGSSWNWRTHKDYYRKMDYKGTLTWVVTDDIMSYLTYSKGTKNGNLDFEGNPIPVEILASWETGLRSRFLNNKLQINGNFYFYNYKNYNEWHMVTKCWNHPVYDTDGVSYTYDANGAMITTTDPALTNAIDADYAHRCGDYGSNPNPTNWTGDGDGPDDTWGTADDEVPAAVPMALKPTWQPGDPDLGIDTYDNEYSNNVAISPGGSEQYGLSVDMTLLITASDSLSARGTWSSNKYKDYEMAAAIARSFPDSDTPYTDVATQVDKDGEEFPNITNIRGNITYNHVMFFGTDMANFNIRANYTGPASDYVVNENRTNEYYMPGRDEYWTYDATLAYRSSRFVPEGWNWSARFSVTNLFDSKFFKTLTYRGDQDWGALANFHPNAGTYGGSFIEPRTMSLTLSLYF